MTDPEINVLAQMAKLISEMSLERKFHLSSQGAGLPEHLDSTPGYSSLAEQFRTQLLLLERSRGQGTAADPQVYASLQEILKIASTIGQT
jgi:hypothetical protein